MRIEPSATHLRVIIPARLEEYAKDYYTNWFKSPITKEDIDATILILKKIQEINPVSLMEMPYATITQKHYDLRSEQEVMYGNEVYAFQVNESVGTQQTIDCALTQGLPTTLHKKYSI